MKNIKMASAYMKDRPHPFPSEDIPQKMRTDAYFAAACNAISSKFFTNRCAFPYNDTGVRRPFWELRAYRHGLNSPNKYKDIMCGFTRKDTGARRTTLNISWDVMQILPQKMDVVMGYLQKINYECTTSAIDYQALISKKTMVAMAKLMADDKMRLMQQQINELAGRPVIEDMDPSQMPGGMPFANPREVDMAAAVGLFFLEQEAAIKMLLTKTEDDSGWDGIADKLKDDLLTLGVCATIARTNPHTHIVEGDYVDPDWAMIPWSMYNDHRDITWGGVGRQVSIGWLRKKLNLPEIELIKIARMYSAEGNVGTSAGFYQDVQQSRTNVGFGMNMMDQIEVDIVECRWLGKKGVNYTSVKRKKDGVMAVNMVDDDYDLSAVRVEAGSGKELNKDTPMTIYKATMVLGTSYVFDTGEDDDISFKKTESGAMFPVFPIKVLRTGNSSLVERCVSFVDDANLDTYKLRVAKMHMPAPPNLMIRKSALENVKINGVTFKPTELMRLLSDEGFLIVDDQNGWGNQTNGAKAIETIPTDVIKQLAEWRLDIEWNISMIERVTGINDIFSAQNPGSEQGLGVSKILVAATNNALTPVIRAYEYCYEQTMRICASKWQVVATYMKEEQRKRLSINRALAYVKIGSDLLDYDFDIRIQAGMTDEQKAQLLADIAKMRDLRRQAGVGGITEADWLLINSTIQNGNIAQAQLLLAQITEIRQKQDDERQANNVAQTAQAQQASNQQTSQNKLQEIGAAGQVDGQNKLQEIDAQLRADLIMQQQKAQDDRKSLALQNVFGSQQKSA